MFLQPCIVLMAALALPGWMSAVSAFPRPEDVSNSGLVVTTTASSATTPQVSTSSVQSTPLPGPPPPPQVRSLHVLSEVQFRYAHTIVSSRVANPADVSQETTFYVVLPETAFISSFAMEIDGKVYKAYVKEKEEAKKTYDAAVASGQAAAHVGVSARDSNSFTVSLNVEPRNKVSFNLTYEELLTRKLGLYEHVITLNPGQVVQDLEVRVHIKENQKIDKLRVPEFTSGNQIAADVQDCEGADCTSNKGSDIATITRKSDYEVEVVFRPTEEDQREIMHKLEAEKKRKALADTDDSQGGDAVAGLLLSMDGSSGGDKDNGLNGQFSVQYDVVRKPDGGEVVVNDGYFVHFFSPVELKPLKKHAIFVLDVSGSMDGRKIEQLREAMTAILGDLKEGDFFTLITFSSDVKALNFDRPERNTVHRPYIHRYYDPENEGQPEQETDRPAPYPATRENIEKAKNIVKTLSAYGGTNINDALKVALDYAREGSRSAAMSNSDQPIEPIILFLTDGDPTVGVTVPAQITAAISDLNLKPRSSIFSLAFGEGADIRFLRKLSLANGGFARNIYEAADASSQLKNFYRQISSPLLANVTFKYLPEKVELDSMTQLHFRSFFAGTELIVAGRLADKGVEEVGGSVSGVTGEGQKAAYTSKLVQADKPLSIYPFDVEGPLFNRTVDQAPRKVSVMERLWAYLTIKQLLDKQDALDASTFKEEVIAPPFRPQPPPMPPVALPARDVVESSTDATSTTASSTDLDLSVLNPEPKKKALELALKYSFVTPLTSLVVVKPNETKATDAHAVNPGGQAAGPSVLGAYAGGAGSVNRHGIHTLSASTLFVGSGAPLALPIQQMMHALAPPPLPPPPPGLHGVVASSALDHSLEAFEPASMVHSLAVSTTSTTSAPDVMTDISDVKWLSQENLQKGFIIIPVNGTDQTLKIARNESEPQPPQACHINGVVTSNVSYSGVCRHFSNCVLSQVVERREDFIKYQCTLGDYLAICCPAEADPTPQSSTPSI